MQSGTSRNRSTAESLPLPGDLSSLRHFAGPREEAQGTREHAHTHTHETQTSHIGVRVSVPLGVSALEVCGSRPPLLFRKAYDKAAARAKARQSEAHWHTETSV